jgi:hypothetical protein
MISEDPSKSPDTLEEPGQARLSPHVPGFSPRVPDRPGQSGSNESFRGCPVRPPWEGAAVVAHPWLLEEVRSFSICVHRIQRTANADAALIETIRRDQPSQPIDLTSVGRKLHHHARRMMVKLRVHRKLGRGEGLQQIFQATGVGHNPHRDKIPFTPSDGTGYRRSAHAVLLSWRFGPRKNPRLQGAGGLKLRRPTHL